VPQEVIPFKQNFRAFVISVIGAFALLWALVFVGSTYRSWPWKRTTAKVEKLFPGNQGLFSDKLSKPPRRLNEEEVQHDAEKHYF
jgi:hypothetical protein